MEKLLPKKCLFKAQNVNETLELVLKLSCFLQRGSSKDRLYLYTFPPAQQIQFTVVAPV